MLKRTPKKRKNSDDSRKKQIDDFIKNKGIKKLDYQDPNNRTLRKGDLKHDYRCSYCNGWEDSEGEFRHDVDCPKNKRKNPIKSIKTNKFTPIADLDLGKTSRSNVVINFEDKEISFTGKDAEEIRDIIKYQLKLFRDSSKLKRKYPSDNFNGGGFYSYLTDVLRDIYPKYFK